ncbi:hypothetical protein EMCRGX_G019369 [Ephydatia muelleri]
MEDVQKGTYPPKGGANPTLGGVYYPNGGAYPPQEGSYPPQGGAYPPQGGAYPPQGGAYPPQGWAYPPQGGAYPLQGGAYPPPSPQPGYVGYIPPQPGYSPAQPPPAYYPQAGAQQQQVTSTIATVQPKATTTVNISYIRTLVDSTYNISIALTLLCFFCGSWFVLCCTVPAMFAASSAKEALIRRDFKAAKRSGLKALVLIIAALVFYVISLIVIIVVSMNVQSQYLYNY